MVYMAPRSRIISNGIWAAALAIYPFFQTLPGYTLLPPSACQSPSITFFVFHRPPLIARGKKGRTPIALLSPHFCGICITGSREFLDLIGRMPSRIGGLLFAALTILTILQVGVSGLSFILTRKDKTFCFFEDFRGEEALES